MASSDLDQQQQRSRRVAFAATALGVALIAISFLPAVAGERDRWTNARARESQDASMQIQKLTHKLGEQQPETANRATEVEYQQAIGHFQNLQTELNEARSDRGILKIALRVCGAALGLAGIAYLLAAQRDQAENA